jgi:O-antigen/teichoic acid export membrane protein
MKFSKSIKDILLTGFTQVLVLFFGLLFLKITAWILDEKTYGLFMVVRRWVAVFAPVLSLNLALGITKFVSSDKKKQDDYLKISLFIVTGIFIVLIGISLFTGESISLLFFNDTRFSLLARILFIYIYANALYLLVYAYYRGRQQMVTANALNLAWFCFPVVLFFVFVFFRSINKYTVLVSYYSLFSLFVIGAAFTYFKKRHLFTFKKMFGLRLEQEKPFFFYGLGRIPSSFFLSLIFGIPVFTATYNISLEAAGYMGISVAVLRMMEVASYPFNMIFLPKFSELNSKTSRKEIKEKSSIVVDFIVTFFPPTFIILYGLSKHIVIFWFGQKFAASVPGLKILILFSAFYMAYAMIRGILNGLFLFPYVNFICLGGFIVSVLLTLTVLNRTIIDLSLGFGISLSILGVSSFYILIKKLNLPASFTRLIKSGIWTGLAFGVLIPGDRFISGLKINIYGEFFLLMIFRLFILGTIFFLFWKKTVWYNELKKRVGKYV